MSSADDTEQSPITDPSCSQLCKDVKTESTDGEMSDSNGHITSVDQQNGGFHIELTLPEVCVKKEETLELSICNTPDVISIKEENADNKDHLYCEDCQSFFFSKCEVHGLPLFVPDSPVPMAVPDRARQTLPPGLEIQKSAIPDAGLGVFNKGPIVPVGAHYGPYQGELVGREEAMNSGYSWVIYNDSQCQEYIDGKKEMYANWMRYVNCARNAEEQNLVAFQYQGEILYRCCRSINPGQELLVWHAKEYPKDLDPTFISLWNIKSSRSDKKIYTPRQALALLNDMDDRESDGSEEHTFVAEDNSEDEFELTLSSDVDVCGISDEESYSPPIKKRFIAENGKRPAQSLMAKDGTVWENMDIESVCVRNSSKFTFSESVGPSKHAQQRITSRLQSFLCLIDTEMLRTITECTVHESRRAEDNWSLSVNELMAFIAVLFLRATLCPVGAMVESWSDKYGVPSIKEIMPRNRFAEIMRYLRFDNKDTRAERVKTDRFAAISDIWERFIRNCIQSYKPGKHITIDEQLFPTKVRCPFLQYISTKPDKFGIKFWIAADFKTKYVCNAIPYLGKDPNRQKGERISENVAMKLMEPFLGKGRTITAGTYFTSLSLANRLFKRNTTLLGAVSTIRRELPSPAKNAKGREQFTTQLYKSGNATLTVYVAKRNKMVCILSTMHQRVQIGEDRKRKPNTVTDYNHMKSGVDVMDQKARAFSVRTASRRWPVAVFYNLLDLAAVNAHVLYKACTGSTESRRDFTHSLAEELRHDFLQEKAILKIRPSIVPGKTTQCQVQTNCNRNHSTERCTVCSKYTCRKCRKEGPWVCSKC